MEFENLIVEKSEFITTLKINRPKALNALNDAVLTDMQSALLEIDRDSQCRVVIITGEGKAFGAGADLTAFENMKPTKGELFSEKGQKVFRNLEILRIPVIAAVNGFALGGGCELAMACDFIYASKLAKFSLPEVGLGLIPGFGGTQRLFRIVGPSRAKELIYTGHMISADEALSIGLVNRVVEPELLMTTCFDVANKIANQAPIAVSKAKEAIHRGLDLELDEGLHHERHMFGDVFRTEDVREGLRAFQEKRKAQFKGK